MKRSLWFVFALVVLPASAQGQEQKDSKPGPGDASKPCLIVKHKGTVGRRLLWTALIGVPIAPGSKYDHVDAINFQKAQPTYKGKELQKFQADGTRVMILEKNYTQQSLDSARSACRETDAQPKQKSVSPEEK
jgi:hypothetical protein